MRRASVRQMVADSILTPDPFQPLPQPTPAAAPARRSGRAQRHPPPAARAGAAAAGWPRRLAARPPPPIPPPPSRPPQPQPQPHRCPRRLLRPPPHRRAALGASGGAATAPAAAGGARRARGCGRGPRGTCGTKGDACRQTRGRRRSTRGRSCGWGRPRRCGGRARRRRRGSARRRRGAACCRSPARPARRCRQWGSRCPGRLPAPPVRQTRPPAPPGAPPPASPPHQTATAPRAAPRRSPPARAARRRPAAPGCCRSAGSWQCDHCGLALSPAQRPCQRQGAGRHATAAGLLLQPAGGAAPPVRRGCRPRLQTGLPPSRAAAAGSLGEFGNKGPGKGLRGWGEGMTQGGSHAGVGTKAASTHASSTARAERRGRPASTHPLPHRQHPAARCSGGAAGPGLQRAACTRQSPPLACCGRELGEHRAKGGNDNE